MNGIVGKGPWIAAQILRIRALEAEVGQLLATSNPYGGVSRERVRELNQHLTLLDLATD